MAARTDPVWVEVGVLLACVSWFGQPTVPTGLLEMWAMLLDPHAALRTKGLGLTVVSSGLVSLKR